MERRNGLLAPEGFWLLTPEAKSEICNGCGAKGASYNFLIPGQLLGLTITECCNIHDYGYAMGLSEADKREADLLLLTNCLRLIEDGFAALRPARRLEALAFYAAVADWGDTAFWVGKEKPV